jgi:hypothetical protein
MAGMKITLSAAMRARDVSRPREDENLVGLMGSRDDDPAKNEGREAKRAPASGHRRGEQPGQGDEGREA